ncbi:MAG: hypothetical protein FWC43_00955 [Planctomycetaceae bacterium]|nr:hypothetical protein [Planctomycetaceae bacterium]
MKTRLLEISNEEQKLLQTITDAIACLDTLAKERDTILTMIIPQGRPVLEFDPDGRTIRWGTESVKLGAKSCQFIKTLWFAKKRRMKLVNLEPIIWGDRLVSSEVVRIFVHRLVARLEKACFPYKILPCKNSQTGDIAGYRLARNILPFKNVTNVTG